MPAPALGIDKILVAIAAFQKLGIDSVALALVVAPNPKSPGAYLGLPKVVADLAVEYNAIKASIAQINDISSDEVQPLLEALGAAIMAIVLSVI
jgi:hypothetical protein